MSEVTPSAEEIRSTVAENKKDFDDEEWEARVEENQQKYGDYGDEDFIAWATAYVDYGEKIDADFALPGGGGGGSGEVPDDLRTIDLSEIETIDQEDDEQVVIRGYVLGHWDGETSKGKPKYTMRLADGSAVENITGYGEGSAKNLSNSGVEVGDFVRVKGVQAFDFVPDDTDEKIYKFSVTPWAEFEYDDPDFTFEEIAKDFENDITNPGDLVHVSGLVTDKNFTEYEGCANCMTSYDPEETRVCPKCASEEMTTYKPGSIQIKAGDKTATVSFSPSDELEVDDPLLKEVEAFGVWEEDERDGTTYKQLDVVTCRLVDEDDADEEEDTEEEEVEEEPEDDSEDEESEAEEESESDEDDSGSEGAYKGEFHEAIQEIEEKVLDFAHEMPAMVGIRVLKGTYGIEDESEQVEIMAQLRDLETVEVDETDGIIEEEEWQDVMLNADE